MATTLQPPKVPLPTHGPRVKQSESPAPSTGTWIALAAITMMFAAFTSAMVVRQGSANDWRHFTFPTVLYFNTLVLVASSLTLQTARRRFRTIPVELSGPVFRGLYSTCALGCLFVFGQYTAWLQLRSEGLYLATNPSSSFFYVFTVLHALHVIGGLLGLTYVIRKLHRAELRGSTLNAASQYWHFMGILWLYLLFVLRSRI